MVLRGPKTLLHNSLKILPYQTLRPGLHWAGPVRDSGKVKSLSLLPSRLCVASLSWDELLTAHRHPLPRDRRSQQKRSFGGLYSEKCKQSFIKSGNVWLLSLSLLYIFSDTQLRLVAPHQKSIFADTYDPKEENDYWAVNNLSQSRLAM